VAVGDEVPAGAPVGTGAAERLVEVLVYTPVGAVLSAVEDLPQWRERGRRAVSGQVTTARVVGELAVRFGRRHLDRAVASWTRPPGPSDQGPAFGGAASEHRSSDPATVPASAPASAPERDRAAGGDASDTVPEVPAHVPPVTSLAIPGFDTLSASQVVPRLDGLARADLVAVRAYEAAHRRRRTVLGRVDQLLAERT
jgi:hypothetical protein